jgi:hypothetical protein
MCRSTFLVINNLFSILGIRNFMKDIEMMLGPRNIVFWAYYLPMWCFITPGAILVCLSFLPSHEKIFSSFIRSIWRAVRLAPASASRFQIKVFRAGNQNCVVSYKM